MRPSNLWLRRARGPDRHHGLRCGLAETERRGMAPSVQKQIRATHQSRPSFDHLVGKREHFRGHLDSKRIGSLQIEDQLEPCDLDEGNVGGLRWDERNT